MAAYAALVSLLNNIEQMMDHPHLSGCFDHQLIQPLMVKVRSLIDFMDANNYGAGSIEADDLEREIAAVAHAVEDVIEPHIVDQIHAGTTEISLNCSLDLQQKIQDLEAVLEKANEFKGSKRSVEEKHTQVVEFGETPMVGLDAELKHLVHELTNGPKSNRKTISIVGMGGMGKSTLAKTIYEDKFIKEHFHFRAWATVSQQHNAQEILAQLISDHKKTSPDLGEELYKNLFGRRYLIILDDIWSVKAWVEVRRFFPDNSNGSRIVLTTRLSNVANDCGSSPFMMKLLDQENSWKLFCEKAFKGEPCPDELREAGEEIVKLCKGLALSIIVMGGLLLKSPRTVEYWKGVVRDIKSISDSKEKQESLDVLSLSYNHLPPHLKPCFLYMGVFEEDSQIHVSNVVQLWVAEGFIKSNGSRVLEEIGEEYIKDLIDRNLISIGRRRKNGKVKSCGIHDLLRDLCIKVGVQQQFFHVNGNIQGTERRLIFWNYSEEFIEGRMPLARCIMSKHIGGHPLKQGLLRVFNYKNLVVSQRNLYEKVNLRYLAYHQSYSMGGIESVWELPTSVSLLWNLQTLILHKDLSCPTVLAPKEIWKMRQLRHVKCRMIYLPPCVGQDELLSLENLQTLKITLNLRVCDEVCKKIPNIKNLHLCYEPHLHGYDDSLIEYLCNLHLLHKLETLYLEICTSKWLSQVTEMNKKPLFPSSLKQLSLRKCELQWEDLTVIGSLPHLQVLILGPGSVRGERWSPVDGQFLNLKFLKIHWADLKYWDVEYSHFPSLEKLVLQYLFDLEEIPLDIGDIPTLELIRVENCSVSAAISAVRIKEDRVENQDDDGLQVQIMMYNKDLKTLTDAVPTDNIQLETF